MNRYLGLLLVPTSLFGAHASLVLKPTAVFSPSRLGNVSVSHTNNRFCVTHNGRVHEVHGHNMDTHLRTLSTPAKVKAFLDHGYVSVNQNSANEFTLASNYRLKGGGPISAGIAYWVTKTLCYGAAITAAGTAVAATGGAAGLGMAGATTLIAGKAGAAAGIASSVMVKAGLTAVATEATVGTVTAAGGLAAAAAAVESASAGVGAFFLALPIP